ncbi:hypothetical protein TSUD_367960 [Trifolium subterraneum]|uniref:RNase H type-1 domain-containing protein n=1 Tax=Trifolium subterraneum TaxID=3900 RepID=A0A2Z6MFN3_TRISU|nr:hypothetical protein TSUD_367960 [Trifolium subterraneum]
MLRQLSKEDAALLACILWRVEYSPKCCCYTSFKPTTGATCIWRKPSAGHVKCNVDASFLPHHNKVGIGKCIRDDQGAFILAKTESFSPKSEVHTGEALGLLAALNWVHELNLGKCYSSWTQK